MTGRVLRSSDYHRMPWKNGGGTTTEIWKAASPAGEMAFQISVVVPPPFFHGMRW